MQPLSENAVNVPAFLSKLWKMVNDPSTDNLISWGPGGKSFIIENQAQFWYELLPVYYKHNNMSSFVRQLNMYGFHKMSTIENGNMEVEKDEIQFYHPYFRKDQPELLKLIKRKVTSTKVGGAPVQNAIKPDDLTKVLSDVKHLRGKQANVDSQLNAMKQENAVLWRELAMLRQKHMKQQQIVNKLIQFLVTIVQPNTRMTGLGVKRHYPLMLNECPQSKKTKKAPMEGPTIHELDTTETVPEELFEDKESPENENTTETDNNQKKSSELLEEVCNMDLNRPDLRWDSPEYVLIVDQQANPLVDELLSDTELPADTLSEEVASSNADENQLNNLDDTADMYSNNEKIFLNSTAPDTLLTNLINGSYNSDVLKDKPQLKKDAPGDLGDLAVAKVEFNRLNSLEELDDHLEDTQSEIDQLKDILHGCNTLDANALLGLFSDDAPDYGLAYQQDTDQSPNKSDPLVSGSELATYNNSFIDFSQLFDDTSDPQDIPQECTGREEPSSSINTPQISNDVPVFPNVSKSSKK